MKTQPSVDGAAAVLLEESDHGDNPDGDNATMTCEESLRLIEDLKFFLATAPVNWQENQIIRRYYLNSDQGFVSCVFWNSLYYITGTDIVKCCMYRMQKFGREIIQKKKFEEGIFSDLRNLKCGIDATLEQPKSDFLSFLFRNMCLKTQKKQKVFFWFSVPHDKLFADALERDLKRESMDQPSTTKAVSEPASSFKFDPMSDFGLYDQLIKHIENKRETNSAFSMPKTQVLGSPQNPIIDDETPASPLQLSNNVIDNNVNLSSQVQSGSTTQSLKQHQGFSSPTTDCNYTPQKLVIVEPRNLELNEDASDNKMSKDNAIVVDDSDHGDFPLDYFPVEIENANSDDELEAFNMQPPFAQPTMFYDNTIGSYEDEVVPPTTSLPRFPTYTVHTPFPHPAPSGTPHFMTNAKYYSTQMKEKSESPNMNSKDSLYMKYSGDENSSEEIEIQEVEFADQQQQQQQQAHVSHYMNPYQKYYGTSMYPSFFLQGPVFGGSSDVVGQNNETINNGYDEMFQLQDGPEQGFYFPYDTHNWSFLPPQAMQPPTATSAFVPKPFTPSFRSTPMSTMNPYMSIAQGGWTQPITSPYGPNATSATSKGYPNNGFYQQQGPNISHRRPFQNGSTASKNYVSKNKASKSYQRKNSSQKSQSKYNFALKNKLSNNNEAKENGHRKQHYSIPTPESNTLNSQNGSNDYDKEDPNFATVRRKKSSDDFNSSD